MAKKNTVSLAEDLLTKSNNALNAAKKGAKTAFVGASDNPDVIQNRQLNYLEEIDRLLKRPSLTAKERKDIKKIRAELRKNYVTSGGILDKVGDPDRFPDKGPKSEATTGTAQAKNAAKQLEKIGSGIRSPLSLGGLLGSSVPETPPPGIPPKLPGMTGTAGTSARNIGGNKSLLGGHSPAPGQGDPGGPIRKAARLSGSPASWRSKGLPTVSERAIPPRPEPEDMGPWKQAGRGSIPAGAPDGALPGVKDSVDVNGSHMMRLRKGLENFDLAKAGKLGGKIAKGGLLGLPLLALDYMAPGNAIAASRDEGYGLLEDMGLDIQGGIDDIDNQWLQTGAGLLDGLVVDPAMTVVGGVKKFREMIVRDAKAASKRRKDRKKNNWKPKLYRGGPQANGT